MTLSALEMSILLSNGWQSQRQLGFLFILLVHVTPMHASVQICIVHKEKPRMS